MNSRRSYAVGISHAQSFIIFGGYDYNGSGRLSSTEIITEQGISAGPEMPEAVFFQAIAGVNATTSILTGGDTKVPLTISSAKTWFFNHVSQQFQAGPSLITGRNRHAAAKIQDHITMEVIVAVVGGTSKIGGILSWEIDSTELLFNGESKWQQGKNHVFASFVAVHSFSNMR